MKGKNICEKKKTPLMVSILSISLLTVMAGAAVAPALSVIQEHFKDGNQIFVQMIISMPAVFIVLTNGFFSRLCERFGSKTLVMTGLLFYTAGGCTAGLFDDIGAVLAMRALVGIGVGIIMPLSTGLLSFYFPPEKQDKLMGYSSAMNQMGGVVATLLSGILAGISWRLSFMVYLLGLLSIVLCAVFLPNDRIQEDRGNDRDGKRCGEAIKSENRSAGVGAEAIKSKNRNAGVGAAHYGESAERYQDIKIKKIGFMGILRDNYVYITAMFLLMTVFFIYPANFAMETVAGGVIPAKYISVIMAMMDFVAFFGGLLFVYIKKIIKGKTKFMAPAMFFTGYVLLAFTDNWFGTVTGSVLIGFANGAGIPFIIFEASVRAGKSAVTTVMPLLSAALYLAQFMCPVLMSAVRGVFGNGVYHLPYCFAAVLAAALCLWSAMIKVSKATA